MEFKDTLNKYIKLLNCSSKDLSKVSGLSPATISRYRTGERVPDIGSQAYEALLNGIVSYANSLNIDNITIEEVRNDFSAFSNKDTLDFELIRNKLNSLIPALNINISQMSKNIGFDASYISRIRSGQRKPADLASFINSVCEYIVKYHLEDEDKSNISMLLNCNIEDIENKDSYIIALKNWFVLNKTNKPISSINNFLGKLNDFNLDDYIKAIHFDTLKVPTVPFRLPNSKTYTGLEELKER